MNQNIRLYFILFIGMSLVFSCKNEATQKDITGEEILYIKQDTIFTKEGNSVVLDSIKKVYYLMRHAEKDSLPKDNPNLTEKGIKRGTLLADILRQTRVDAIYSTFYTRTLFTVDSLADIKAMTISPYEHKNLRLLVDALQSDDHIRSVVIVGHSNSTPALANSLVGKEVFNTTFDESDYDNFVIVYEKINGQKEVLKLKYSVKE
ncbi:MAG: phosphoglycerate mutase family protein [Saprospiraceae bacterium]